MVYNSTMETVNELIVGLIKGAVRDLGYFHPSACDAEDALDFTNSLYDWVWDIA